MKHPGAARPPLAGLGLVVVLSLTACSEDGSIDLPSPSASPTRTDLPSRTGSLPSPTRTPSRGESEEPTPSPSGTSSPTEEESPSEPASESAPPTRTTAPTETASGTVTATVSATPTPSPSPSPDATDSGTTEDSGTPPWVWWLLAAAGLAAVIAAFLVPRSRRRSAWRAELAAAEGEATWLSRELLPQLQQVRSREELAGAWQVSAGRVVATEDQLTGLEPTAPDEAGRSRVLELRAAVRDARRGVETLVVSGEATALARDLGAIAARLSDTVSPPPTP